MTMLSEIVGAAVVGRSVNAMGDVRTDKVLANYDVDYLLRGATGQPIANPANSPGCTPILRAIIDQTGMPYGIGRELSNDGESYGHQGGNAIDVIAASTSTDEHGALAALCVLLQQVPELFATVIHYDPDYPANDLYIHDGQVTDNSAFGGTNSITVTEALGRIHISSSLGRLTSALTRPTVQAVLAPGGTAHTSDRFGDRSVEIAGGLAVPKLGLAISTEARESTPVRFW